MHWRSFHCEHCGALLRPSMSVDGIVACDYCGTEHVLTPGDRNTKRAEAVSELLRAGILAPGDAADLFDPLGLFH